MRLLASLGCSVLVLLSAPALGLHACGSTIRPLRTRAHILACDEALPPASAAGVGTEEHARAAVLVQPSGGYGRGRTTSATTSRRRVAAAARLSAAAPAPAASVDTQSPPPQALTDCRYDHLHFFVDALQPLAHYKAIEDRLNEFARLVPRAEGAPVDIAAAREVWRKMGDSADPNAFEVHGRDLVEQMLYGFGWRITGQHEGAETRSLLLSTPDTAGVS